MQEMNSGSPIIPKVYNVEHIVILNDKSTETHRGASARSRRLLAELRALPGDSSWVLEPLVQLAPCS